MKIIEEIHDQFTKRTPIVLTIGFFDGVHLGHQRIFSKVKELKGDSGLSFALTFKNHPQTVLKPHTPFPLISSLNQRIQLIKDQGINTLILLDFDQEMKNTSADDFLLNLHEHIPFDHLVLGPNATIGRKKEGDAKLIQLLSKKYSFDFHPQSFCFLDRKEVSSTLIRDRITLGSFKEVSELLNRPYSIVAPVIPGEQIGTILGFPTLNLNIQNLALPPLGVYKVHLMKDGKPHLAIANLGLAPTLQERRTPVLEVHLLDYKDELIEKELEIVFLDFIRKEKKFSSIDDLKAQINLDIQSLNL